MTALINTLIFHYFLFIVVSGVRLMKKRKHIYKKAQDFQFQNYFSLGKFYVKEM